MITIIFKKKKNLFASDLYMCLWTCVHIHLMPFLWSNAGIMDAGCSDIRATSSWSTSWIFSSWGKESKVEQVNKGGRGSPMRQTSGGLRGQRESCRGGQGGGLRRSRWYFRARIDIIVTEEYIVFSPLLCHFSCCHSAEDDSHSRSFKWTKTLAYKL